MVTTDEKINLDTLEKIESANRVKKHESMEEYAGRPLSPKEVDEMWEKIQENKKKDEAIMKKETQSRARAKNKAFPMGKKYGGIVKMSNGGPVPSKYKGFSKLPEPVQEKIDPSLATKYKDGGMVNKNKTTKNNYRGQYGIQVKKVKFKGIY
jgi:hypothetical protein